MSNAENETPESTDGISDEQLPDDLQPSEDNPLAEPLDEDVDPEDLDMDGGRKPDQWDDEDVED